MNLSTSNSDQTEALAWSRWLLLLVTCGVIGSIAALAFVVAVDPFSTGRMTPIDRIDYVTNNRLYGDLARVRNPSFDAAIFGNSHALRIVPEQLNHATGRRFAMLGIEGTRLDQQIFLMHQFYKRRRDPVMIVVLDDFSCAAEVEPEPMAPRWLYDGSTFEYLSRILSPFSVRESIRRVLILFGLTAGVAPDGYDPTPWQPWGRDQMARDLITMSPPTEGPPANAPLPYLDELERTMREVGPLSTVLLVFGPVYVKHLPVPGSNAVERLTACKERAAAIARTVPHAGLLDLYVKLPGTEDPGRPVSRETLSGSQLISAVDRGPHLARFFRHGLDHHEPHGPLCRSYR